MGRNVCSVATVQGAGGSLPCSQTARRGWSNLGAWVNHQRQIKKKGNLPSVRQVPLNNLGFVWDVKQDLWDVKFALLQQFRERKGHCRVPKGHREDGEALEKWVCDQRCLLKKEESDQHKKNRLLELGFRTQSRGSVSERLSAMHSQCWNFRLTEVFWHQQRLGMGVFVCTTFRVSMWARSENM
jgi:hypothetical protein